MGQFLNPDNGAFRTDRGSKIYVDKTGLLNYTNSVLETSQMYICNSRPRRFGKSYTADMLAAYYSRGCDSDGLFEGLEISHAADYEKYRNRFDVIHLDIQWFWTTAKDQEHIVQYISDCVMQELRDEYPDEVLTESESLAFALSRVSERRKIRFVIIIDEWDFLIRDEYRNHALQKEYIGFLRSLFKGTEPSKYIELAYLTGILPIVKTKTESALNNFDEFTMISPGTLAPYFGFTQQEVQALCAEYAEDFEKVRSWYDGYLLNGMQIYNPKAVVSVMLRGEYKSYWSETGSYKTVVQLISHNFDGLKDAVIAMLSGSAYPVNVKKFENNPALIQSRDDVITYLIHLGYLGYNQAEQTAFVPNEEVRQELSMAVEDTHWDRFQEFWNDSEDLLGDALDGNAVAVASAMEKIHDEYCSAVSYNREESLSAVLTVGFLASIQYYFKPVREMPAGRGFADFVYLPRPENIGRYPALIVELKWNKKVQTALDQIVEKKYPESVKDYTGDILLIGISYDRKTRQHQCRIEETAK